MNPNNSSTSSELSVSATQRVVADVTAGIVVFLVALPLCLGIALASGASPFSGLVAGIIGGIVVGLLSGSHTSVSGPAAGLAAVVAAQLAILKSPGAFYLAVFLAGVIQIVLGIIRAGTITSFVPSSVIRGLLASIGMILIIKQAKSLVGYSTELLGATTLAYSEPVKPWSFWDDPGSIWNHIHPASTLIGFGSLAILVTWDSIPRLKKLLIPAPLVVVVAAAFAGIGMANMGGSWELGAKQLVQVPAAASFSQFTSFFERPDFGAFANPQVYMAALTIAIVASLETLLNLDAVDRLDTFKRVSPANRELFAQGVGNFIAGLIGGLPITSVIVRSSVNINSGARTKASAVIHGVLLLGCVALLPTMLNKIPLSCLAAILITTGYKLAGPKVFRQMWKLGLDQFVPFTVTVAAILATDLLVGTLIGLCVSVLFILVKIARNSVERSVERHSGSEVVRLKLSAHASFINRLALKKQYQSVSDNALVMIDASNAVSIDADMQALIFEFIYQDAPNRGIRVGWVGLHRHIAHMPDRVEFQAQASGSA